MGKFVQIYDTHTHTHTHTDRHTDTLLYNNEDTRSSAHFARSLLDFAASGPSEDRG